VPEPRRPELAHNRTEPQLTAGGTAWPHRIKPRASGSCVASRSDFPVMEKAVEMLGKLGVPCEMHAISAHRAPDLLFSFVAQRRRAWHCGLHRGRRRCGTPARCHRAKTVRPVIGVPIATQVGGGLTRSCRSSRCRRAFPLPRSRSAAPRTPPARGGDPGSRRPGAARTPRSFPRSPDAIHRGRRVERGPARRSVAGPGTATTWRTSA